MASPEELLKAVHHIVHDYANLVSAGMAIPTAPPPPLNSHVHYSFILQTRKFAHFFLRHESRYGKRDILGCDYVGRKVIFELPEWSKWKEHMDCHIFHLSYGRLDNTRVWSGGEHPIVLQEFQRAWSMLLSHLPLHLRAEFDKQIDEKLAQLSAV